MMAVEPSTAMPERWTELAASRRQKRVCAEQVQALKQSCEKGCGKAHISACPDCYEKVLERIRKRYAESDGREWFTERRAFIQELEGLFAEVKQRKQDLKTVEARIESEKEAWYRWMLRTHPDFLAVAEDGARQNELRLMLDDPDQSQDELVKMMWEGIVQPADWSLRVDQLVEKVEAADGNEEELKKIYVEEFFIDNTTGQPWEHAERYLTPYKEDRKLTLEEVVGKIVQDDQLNRSSQPNRDNHKSRLDELRRAKTAFEHDRAQTKARFHAAQMPPAGAELYDLPPCYKCEKPVDTKDVISCAICQAVAQLGGEKKLTVYCSETCYRDGHDAHAEKEHDCESGKDCVQLHDEDVEMGDAQSKLVLCKECLDIKEVTPYCSERCAVQNIASHRLLKHESKTSDAQSLVSPLEEVVMSTLKTKNPGLNLSVLP